MNLKKINKKISKTINSHTQDTGFGLDTDSVGLCFMNIKDSLENLQNYLEKGDLSWKELRSVAVSLKTIDDTAKNFTSILNNEKQAAKYLPVINAALEEAAQIKKTILKNNSIDTTIEIGIANKILEEMKKLQDQEAVEYEYLYKTVTSGKTNFTANHIEGDEFALVNLMEEARKLCAASNALTTSSEFKSQLETIQKEAVKFFDDFSKTVIENYDTLHELDLKLNKDDQLVKNVKINLTPQNDTQIDF